MLTFHDLVELELKLVDEPADQSSTSIPLIQTAIDPPKDIIEQFISSDTSHLISTPVKSSEFTEVLVEVSSPVHSVLEDDEALNLVHEIIEVSMNLASKDFIPKIADTVQKEVENDIVEESDESLKPETPRRRKEAIKITSPEMKSPAIVDPTPHSVPKFVKESDFIPGPDVIDPNDYLYKIRHTREYEVNVEPKHVSKVLPPERLETLASPLSQRLRRKSMIAGSFAISHGKNRNKGAKKKRRNSINSRLDDVGNQQNLMVNNYVIKGS